jgi:hypothetical protein
MLYGRWSEHWRILQQQHLYNKAGDNEVNGVFQKKDTAQLSLLWNNADGQWAITICCHTFCSFRPEEKEFYFKATY